jgi:hypothetical protein
MALKLSALQSGDGPPSELVPFLPSAASGHSPGGSEIVVISEKDQKKMACRYATGTVVLVSGATVTFFRYYQRWSHPVAVTFSAVYLGASAQGGTEFILPRSLVQKIHRFQQHYLTPELLALWQVYLNFGDIPWLNELALGALCVIGGSYFVIKITSVATKRMSDLHANRKTYGDKEWLNVYFEPKSPTTKRCWKVFKAAVGAGMMVASVWVKGWATTLLNLGAFAVCHAAGGVAQGFFDEQRRKLEHGLLVARESDPKVEIPRSLRCMRVAAKTSYIFGKTAWGIMIVVDHPAAYGAIGFIIGGSKRAELKEFRRMTAIKPEEDLSPKMQLAAKVFNGALLAGAHAYTLYAIGTSDTWIDRAVLSAFLGGGYLGFGITKYMIRNFDPSTNNGVMNTVQFYTDEHTDIMAFLYLYIKSQMELGDEALIDYGGLEKAAALLAYFTLGFVVGDGQASPYESDKFPSIGDAFVGKLLTLRATGELS